MRLRGKGRLPDPESILEQIRCSLKKDLMGEKVLITAGPSREPLDPVRQSPIDHPAKMGYATRAAARRGRKSY